VGGVVNPRKKTGKRNLKTKHKARKIKVRGGRGAWAFGIQGENGECHSNRGKGGCSVKRSVDVRSKGQLRAEKNMGGKE